MDNDKVAILNESNRLLNKLQLLAAFFSNDIIYKVYLRSVVIHQLFENNEELDANKLDLFHLQFTVTVIELLKKIKKSNEKNVTLLFNEIQANQELIAKIEDVRYTADAFRLEKQRQALKVNTSLKRLYEELSNDNNQYPFAKNINSFSARFAPDFYSPVTAEVLGKLTHFEPNEVYSNAHAIIQRKLMGLLCKYDFKTEFYCGLKTGTLIIEVYKITLPGIYYVFYPSRNLFLLCDASEVEEINKTVARDKPDTLIQELYNKNDQLQSRIAVAKIYLPIEIKQLMDDHYRKISDINFLQNISDFDVQANILKTMLNTNII
jgi:hypothetical protein